MTDTKQPEALRLAAWLKAGGFINMTIDDTVAIVNELVSQQTRIAELEAMTQELSKIIRNVHVANQAAWIEWQHGKGVEAGMQWIENGLCGPGLIPDENEPYGKEAQAWFDANKADPFPACFCGRPSNQLWMGKGFCSTAHYDQHRASLEQEGEKS